MPDFSPCGLVVQNLRSCYETDARPFRDDETVIRLRWYFVPDGTPQLPFGTIFTSLAWLDEPEGDSEIGEVPGADRQWTNGDIPSPALPGDHPCGTADDFAQGGLIGNAGILTAGLGTPICCFTPAELANPAFCQALETLLPPAYRLSYIPAAPAAGQQGPTAGPVILRRTIPCRYEGTGFGFANILPGPHAFTIPWHLEFLAPDQYTLGGHAVELPASGGGTNTSRTDPTQAFSIVGDWIPNSPPYNVLYTLTPLWPGDPTLANPLLCPGLSARTWGAYYLVVPVAFNPPGFWRIVPGTYTLFQSDNCQWQGTVDIQRTRFSPARIRQDVTLDVFPDGSAELVFQFNTMAVIEGRFTWSSEPGWDGNTPLGFLPLSLPLGWFLTWPPFLTVNAPVLP